MFERLVGGASRAADRSRSAPTIGFVALLAVGRITTCAADEAVPTPYVPYHSVATEPGAATTASQRHPADLTPIKIIAPATTPRETPSSKAAPVVDAPKAATTIGAGSLVPVNLPTESKAAKPVELPREPTSEDRQASTAAPMPTSSAPRAELKPASIRPATTSLVEPVQRSVAKPESAADDTAATTPFVKTIEAGPLQEIRPPSPAVKPQRDAKPERSVERKPTAQPKAASEPADRPGLRRVELAKPVKSTAPAKPVAVPQHNLPQPPIPFIEAARRTGRLLLPFRSSRAEKSPAR